MLPASGLFGKKKDDSKENNNLQNGGDVDALTPKEKSRSKVSLG